MCTTETYAKTLNILVRLNSVRDDSLLLPSEDSPRESPNRSTSRDYPPRTSIMMLSWLLQYPGYCCLSSHIWGSYFLVFSSCFCIPLSIHGQLISTVMTFFSLWSMNPASTLFYGNYSCSANTSTSQYAFASRASYKGLAPTREYHGGTESASLQP